MPYRNPETTRCTALRSNGQFCDDESLPDAPFPICVKHAAEILRFLSSHMPVAAEDQALVAARGIGQQREREAKRRAARPQFDVVYYVRIGERIKIGTTTNLPLRLRSYPPGWDLLTYEPGGITLERQRHRQFAADLAAGREWFRPSPDLLAHINKLRAVQAAS